MKRRRLRVADLFAGGGGTSHGVSLVPELELVFAANHWPAAVELHARRHPHAMHACQDLTQFDFRRMPCVDILWASPACQGHSEAAQPARALDLELAIAHDHLRTSAWAVVNAVLARYPRAFVVENVPQFLEWTFPPRLVSTHSSEAAAERAARRHANTRPVWRVVVRQHRDGRWMAIEEFAPGQLYQHWRRTLALAGYHITEQVVLASRWGVPQRRSRLLLVGHLDGELALREPDVAAEDEPTLEPILDFDSGEWTPICEMPERRTAKAKRGASAKDRAQHAHETFGGAPCWGQHASHRGAWARSVAMPSSTVTTQNQHYMVRRGAYRLWSVPETAQVQSFPADYFADVERTAALVMAGNAVPPLLAAGVLRQVAASL